MKCNKITAQALVPEDLLKKNIIYTQLLNNWNDELVRSLGNVFGVSREVILGRLLVFNNINFNLYRRKMDQYHEEFLNSKLIKNTDNTGFLAKSEDKGTQFGKVYIGTVLTAYNNDIITARDAIQYFDGLRLKHFEKLEQWCFA